MNLMTSSPEDEPITRSQITITGLTVNGGFAEAQIGGKVYISRAAVKRLRLQAGESYAADLVPNHAQPDKTPWFAMHITDPASAVLDIQPSEVLEFLQAQGDAWTAAQVCENFLSREPTEADIAEMHRLLDRLYLGNRGIAKVMMFTQAAPGGPVETWFTAVPDRIDVGEFED